MAIKRNCLFFLLALTWTITAQAIDIDTSQFYDKEELMRDLIKEVLTSKDSAVRANASIDLEKTMEEVLKKGGSYNYPFSNLAGVSIVQPSDKAFRIFTWQLFVADNSYHYKGFIQTKEGKVFQLKDESDDMRTVEFSTLRPENWYGALYYNIKEFKHEGQPTYLLFGYDAFEFYNRRKVLDVFYFDAAGKPKFGKSVLEMKDGQGRMHQVKRFLMEYSSSVNVTLNYSEEQNMVVYDHLVYGSPVKGAGPSNVPDGSYCGLKLTKDGIWQYVDKVHKDDPANILVDATSFEIMIKSNQEQPRKNKKDLFGRRK